jgi:hypothetical protein
VRRPVRAPARRPVTGVAALVCCELTEVRGGDCLCGMIYPVPFRPRCQSSMKLVNEAFGEFGK